MSGRRLAVLALALALLGAAAGPAFAQCAMCKTALSGSPEGRHMVRQFNFAILMMVFSPYLVAATVAGVLFRRQIGAHLARLGARLPEGRWPFTHRLPVLPADEPSRVR